MGRLVPATFQTTPANSKTASPTRPQDVTPGTGGAANTVVVAVALLLAVIGSDSLPVTLAVLVIVPVVLVELTFTLMSIEDEALTPRVPRLQVTVGAPEQSP
jgi:hypothetical protein